MRVLAGLLLCTALPIFTVRANVEKTIFLGPAAVTLPDVRPSLVDLRLHAISHEQTILPTRLPVQFPSKAAPHGLESWYLLRDLEVGRRYEARICWPATQPTDFWLDTFTISDVFGTSELVESLARYSDSIEELDQARPKYHDATERPTLQSVLFLRVQATASYYSSNRTLMEHPEPVDVDIILDPFLLNVLPQSLGPVAIYLAAVTIGAWFLTGYIYRWLLSVATEPSTKPHGD